MGGDRNLYNRLESKTKSVNTFVLSMDIRQSTELMLLAKTPFDYEEFIVHLCNKLTNTVKENFGIFDKFTGDGILAFFPSFYSGDGRGGNAIKCAFECVKIFDEVYEIFRSNFDTVLDNTGLTVGIDCGTAQFVNMNGSYTVIGKPVVYACRLSCAPAGTVILNNTAYDFIAKKYSRYLNFEREVINIKNGRYIYLALPSPIEKRKNLL